MAIKKSLQYQCNFANPYAISQCTLFLLYLQYRQQVNHLISYKFSVLLFSSETENVLTMKLVKIATLRKRTLLPNLWKQIQVIHSLRRDIRVEGFQVVRSLYMLKLPFTKKWEFPDSPCSTFTWADHFEVCHGILGVTLCIFELQIKRKKRKKKENTIHYNTYIPSLFSFRIAFISS